MVSRQSASTDQLALQYEVASILARSREAGDGLARALERISCLQDWDIGVAWLTDGDHLRYATEFVSPQPELSSPAVRAFLESVRRWLRGKGRGAVGSVGPDPGLCLCSAGACHQLCAWGQSALEAGLRSAVLVPLVCEDRVYGALEFFSRQDNKPDLEHRRALESVGRDLGRYLKIRRFETRMQSRNARLAEAQRIARLAYWECSVAGWRLRSQGNMGDVLGLPDDALPNSLDEYFRLVPEEEQPGLRVAMTELQDPAMGSIEFEHHVVSPASQALRVVVIRALADFDSAGKVLRISGTLQDITPYRRLENRLHLAATAIDHAGDAIVIFDARGAIMSTNPAFSRITGYPENEVQGSQLDALLNRPSGRHDESFYRQILGRLRTFGYWKGELWARRRDGRDFAMLLSLSEVRDGMGRVTHHVGVFTDVSRQKEYKERLELLALHDSLTGLPNRALFLDRGQQALALAQRNGTQIGLIFADLDLFKSINDLYGHAVGDLVLREAGSRMRRLMRECDTVARLGGDEFVVLLTDVCGSSDCVSAAERLIHGLTQPYFVNGGRLQLGVSLGVALSDGRPSDIDALLDRADQALYSIKRDSVRRYAIWTPDLSGEEASLQE